MKENEGKSENKRKKERRKKHPVVRENGFGSVKLERWKQCIY